MFFLTTNDDQYRIGIDDGNSDGETGVIFKPRNGGLQFKVACYADPNRAQRAAMDCCSKYNDAVKEGFQFIQEGEGYFLVHPEGARLSLGHLADSDIFPENFVDILRSLKEQTKS